MSRFKVGQEITPRKTGVTPEGLRPLTPPACGTYKNTGNKF